MAFTHLGQIRKSNTVSYTTPYTFTKDKNILSFQGENIFHKGETYYCNFNIKRSTTAKILNVWLKKKYGSTDEIQKIGSYTIGGGKAEDVNIEIICSPIDDFDQLEFEVEGEVEILQVAFVKNLLKQQQILEVLKIGVQGPVGLLLGINGEAIRIGRSGLYEMDYDIPITSIGVIPIADKYFAIDYQY